MGLHGYRDMNIRVETERESEMMSCIYLEVEPKSEMMVFS